MKAPSGLIGAIEFARHSLVTMGRQTAGRWYIFRDRPYWFVVVAANMARRHILTPTPRIAEWHAEANAEWRRRRQHRKIEAMK